MGFILGPALAVVSQNLLGKAGPGLVAAGICGVNSSSPGCAFPERKPGTHSNARRPRLEQIRHVLELPLIGFLVLVFFLATFGFTCFETTMGFSSPEIFTSTSTRPTTPMPSCFVSRDSSGRWFRRDPLDAS